MQEKGCIMQQTALRYILVVPAYKQIAVNAILRKLEDRAKALYSIENGCSRFGVFPPSHFYCAYLTQEAFDVATIVLDNKMSHCYWCSFFDGDFVWDTKSAECATRIGEKVSDNEFLKFIGLKSIKK
jgi:hypothetical protein